ncbi:MAG: hypothetical protein J6386_08770 [Candidatus Synoicihabitans palmerolidicus]|nr:hypothetical protein [Candidatus Synoicihabitans palmerolidicus]
MNLVSNAIKFTNEGSVKISVDLQTGTDDSKESIRIRIIDTRIGIPAAAQAKLLSPFTQVDGSHTRRHTGTGLGLTISHQLVALMGGTMSFTSEEGAGSQFQFTVPFVTPPRSAPDVPAPQRWAKKTDCS